LLDATCVGLVGIVVPSLLSSGHVLAMLHDFTPDHFAAKPPCMYDTFWPDPPSDGYKCRILDTALPAGECAQSPLLQTTQ